MQDSNDHNPMLRALAIRTMGCIRVDRIIEYLCDPLEKALKVRSKLRKEIEEKTCIRKEWRIPRGQSLASHSSLPFEMGATSCVLVQSACWRQLASCMQDTDPYVRKTAAICVAKLHDMSPELVRDRGFLDLLKDMTTDSNPMVVSNSVAALAEIYEASGEGLFTVSRATASYLLTAMEQCTEWGQVRYTQLRTSRHTWLPQNADRLQCMPMR